MSAFACEQSGVLATISVDGHATRDHMDRRHAVRVNAQREARDVELVRALIAHEHHAPRVLWRRFAPLVFRILRRTFGPGQEIEDLAQDIFLCVFEKISTLREPAALRKFIISITTITARSEIRRRWVRRWSRLGSKEDDGKEAAFHVDLDSREALRRFYAILDRLNGRDRMLFVLRFMEDLGLRDVAAASGLSLATAKRRLARARSKVRLLAERDPLLCEYVTGDVFGQPRAPDPDRPADLPESVVAGLRITRG
jgi:RNA polymerase sigma-70 factor (ECF subfamily)